MQYFEDWLRSADALPYIGALRTSSKSCLNRTWGGFRRGLEDGEIEGVNKSSVPTLR